MNTKELSKKTDEAIMRYYLHQQAVVNFKANCFKLCPGCGTFLPIDSRGCDRCFFQFGREYYSDKDRC